MNILSLHPLRDTQIETIKAACPDARIHLAKASDCAPYLPNTEILLAFGQANLAPILPHAPKLRWVQALTAGVDGFIALDAFRQSDILLTNVRGIHGIPIAEHVLGMILCRTRGLLTAHDNQISKQWRGLRGLEELGLVGHRRRVFPQAQGCQNGEHVFQIERIYAVFQIRNHFIFLFS